ncbi:MAG: hypothetical protein M3295_09870, partial [Chloroflexota bacterium]|nr:hypothetical protein [Chloroflexota bacterium]
AVGGLPPGATAHPGDPGVGATPAPQGGGNGIGRGGAPEWLWPVAGVVLIGIIGLGAFALRRIVADAADGDR